MVSLGIWRNRIESLKMYNWKKKLRSWKKEKTILDANNTNILIVCDDVYANATCQDSTWLINTTTYFHILHPNWVIDRFIHVRKIQKPTCGYLWKSTKLRLFSLRERESIGKNKGRKGREKREKLKRERERGGVLLLARDLRIIHGLSLKRFQYVVPNGECFNLTDIDHCDSSPSFFYKYSLDEIFLITLVDIYLYCNDYVLNQEYRCSWCTGNL